MQIVLHTKKGKDKGYAKTLYLKLLSDISSNMERLRFSRVTLEDKLEELERCSIDYTFLTKKCNEAIEKSLKLSKKGNKYSKKDIESSDLKYKNIYNMYIFLEAVRETDINLRDYIEQIRVYERCKET